MNDFNRNQAIGKAALALSATAALVGVAVASPRLLSAAPAFDPKQDPAKGKMEIRIEPIEIPRAAPVREIVVFDNVAPVGKVAVQGGVMDNAKDLMIQHLTPILRGELRAVTLVNPSPSQRRAIALEGGRALKMVADNITKRPNGVGPNGINIQNRRGGLTPVNYRKSIHDAVEAEVKDRLSAEQLARYQEEIQKKAEDRKEVVLLNMVVNLEKTLLLRPDQRSRLCDALRKYWSEETYPPVEMLEVYGANTPNISDSTIMPILTEDQKAIWRSLPKIDFRFLRNPTRLDNVGFDLEAEEDDDLKAALAKEPQP